MISIIAAMTKQRVIGKNNKLPWNIPDDLKNFKKLTQGSVVIMGRKTFESIGRPLANRENIVVSSSLKADGVLVCSTVSEALEKAKSFKKEIFIIGGSTIYEQTLNVADRMYISYVKKDYEGDAFFPTFNELDWVVESEQDFTDFKLVTYGRSQKA